ncbi:hypothetical protein NS234_02305 [Microbacterium oxydans]|uniref:hypothetical protein n=1 Tax=Microbacterium oxydans TaxID=82380 RepID=UPI0007341FF3|nr:hypothetical protein [Microbacterium oxydans]KTR78862.1 hypothetical protein NS234_02305 [Microbacterium oxydans]
MAYSFHGDNPIGRQFIEAAGVGALENFLARAQATVARPNRQDTPVDAVAINEDLLAVPLQLKVVLKGGLTVHRKYLGLPLKLVYVNLGHELGGLHENTSFVVLEPEVAWQLPTLLGLKFDPDYHDTYRWPTTTRALRIGLEPYTCRSPEELASAVFG